MQELNWIEQLIIDYKIATLYRLSVMANLRTSTIYTIRDRKQPIEITSIPTLSKIAEAVGEDVGTLLVKYKLK